MDAPESWLEELAVVRARVDSRLEGVGRVLVVMSGKGGVGKTAVATNLALSLASRGPAVGLLDADLNSPTVARALGMRGRPVRMLGEELLPQEGPAGLGVQSMDFFLQGTQALDWDGSRGEAAPLRSALEDAALADLIAQTRWGALDWLIVDLAPGADRLPALRRLTERIDIALAVTIPTEVSVLAVERSLRRAADARIEHLALVENMASVVCPRCGDEHALYAEASPRDLSRDAGVDLWARIPFDPRLAAAADAGRAFVRDEPDSPAARAFAKLAERVQGEFAEPARRGEA